MKEKYGTYRCKECSRMECFKENAVCQDCIDNGVIPEIVMATVPPAIDEGYDSLWGPFFGHHP